MKTKKRIISILLYRIFSVAVLLGFFVSMSMSNVSKASAQVALTSLLLAEIQTAPEQKTFSTGIPITVGAIKTENLLNLPNIDVITYTDTDYGFLFKYPSTWTEELIFQDNYSNEGINRKRMALYSEDNGLFYITVWLAPDGNDLPAWIKNFGTGYFSSATKYPSQSNVTITGENGFFVVSPPDKFHPGILANFIEKEGYIYCLEYIGFDGGNHQQDFMNLISTFEFDNSPKTEDKLPISPFFPAADIGTLALNTQDCCGYHDNQPNRYPCSGGNCTWWAAYKRDDISTQYLGDAYMWRDNAPNFGLVVGKTAKVGAVAVFQPGVAGADPIYGHVAYVITAYTTSTFRVSSMSWGGDCIVSQYDSYVRTGVDFIYPGENTPPVTSISLSGTIGDNGWYLSEVQVTLSAVDNSGGSGVSQTQYQIDSNTGTWQVYSVPFPVSADGVHTVYYKSMDAAGNWEIEKNTAVNVDATSPTGSFAIQNGSAETYSTTVELNTQGNDSTSGIAAVRFRDAGQVTWSSWYLHGPVFWQLIGSNGQTASVEAQIRDNAGNVSAVYLDSIKINLYPSRPSSSLYILQRSTFGASGMSVSSSQYVLNGTAGQPTIIGYMESYNYKMNSGYWAKIETKVYKLVLPLILR